MNKHILITGGAGFIGSNLSLRLLESGHSVRVLDNLSPQIHGNDPEKSYTYKLIKDKVEFIKGDVARHSDWKKAMDNIDIIIHLAAETGTGQSMYRIGHYVKVNTSGIANMLDVITNSKHSVSRIILASSRAVYGEGKYMCGEHGIVYPSARMENDMTKGDFECKCPVCRKSVLPLPTDEASAIKPSSVYAVTKYNQEQLLDACCNALGIDRLIFRLQNVYGPGQSLKNPYTGVLSVFYSLFRENQLVNIFEDGNESRDFIYINDVTSVISQAINTGNPASGIYNIGSGEPEKISDVAGMLRSVSGSSSDVKISGNFRLGDIRANYADISLLLSVTGYIPRTGLKEGLIELCNWAMQNDSTIKGYKRSLRELKERNLFR